MFFPPPGFFRTRTTKDVAKSESEELCNIPKKESNASKIKRENNACDNLS